MSTTATLNYIKPLPVGIKPYTWIDAPPAGMPSTNTAVDAHRVLIADVRSLPEAERPTLEDNGGTFLFGAGVGSGQEMNWDDDEEVKRKYYPELEEVLKKQTGAAKVVSEWSSLLLESRPDGREVTDVSPTSHYRLFSSLRPHCAPTYQSRGRRGWPQEPPSRLCGPYRPVSVPRLPLSSSRILPSP